MSQLWFDNPDYYNTATMARFWSSVDADATVTAGAGYDGAGGLTATADGFAIAHFVVGDPLNRFRVGCRFKATALPGAAKIILGVVDDDDVVQVCVSLNTNGTLTIWRGPMTTALATSTATVSLNTHHRIGFKGLISKTVGEAEVHLDSALGALNKVADAGVANTSESDLVSWHGVYVGLFTNMVSSHCYANDGEGTVNDLLHGFRTRYEFLNAADLDEWTPNTGTMVAALDDATPDDDTTYIYTDTFHDRYTGTVSFPVAQKVYGVQTTALVRNLAESGYSPSHQPMVVVGGVEYIAAFQSVVVDAWRAIRKLWPVNPATSAPWTLTEANAATYGGRVEA